jgi:hypothetical protein
VHHRCLAGERPEVVEDQGRRDEEHDQREGAEAGAGGITTANSGGGVIALSGAGANGFTVEVKMLARASAPAGASAASGSPEGAPTGDAGRIAEPVMNWDRGGLMIEDLTASLKRGQPLLFRGGGIRDFRRG